MDGKDHNTEQNLGNEDTQRRLRSEGNEDTQRRLRSERNEDTQRRLRSDDAYNLNEDTSSVEWIFQQIIANASDDANTDANTLTDLNSREGGSDFQITPDLVASLLENPYYGTYDEEIINSFENEDFSSVSNNLLQEEINRFSELPDRFISMISVNNFEEIFNRFSENARSSVLSENLRSTLETDEGNINHEIEILCILFSRLEIVDEDDEPAEVD
ncbi:UNVERIFIED_CONTAM: hypothetical protein RMT77_001022 [Armadillidium vulgare]